MKRRLGKSVWMITDGLEFMSKIEWLFWNQINVKVKIEIKIKA